MPFGMGELLIILVIVLLIFGAGKLPQIGDALGRSIKNFKKASSGNEPAQDAIEVSKKREREIGPGSTADDEAEVVASKTETVPKKR